MKRYQKAAIGQEWGTAFVRFGNRYSLSQLFRARNADFGNTGVADAAKQ
ncbi:hypothetical protein [Dehalogenimonas alkenigignens]|nr:hypothetical protein [Dehalogenimonas alkenigignens]